MGIWAIEVADGKPQGTPQLLKPEIGRLYPLGLTRNGSYYYGIFSRGSNIYVAAFDPQKGNVTGEPTLAIQRNWGSNWAPAWSPDGRYLACVSSNPDAGPEHRFAPPYHFLIRSMETGEVRELSPELTDFDVRSLSWSPDGRSLLGAGKTKKDVRPGILKIDVETGNATTIGTRGGRSPNSAPDGKTIFDVHRGRKGWAIYRHDLTAGDKKVVFRAAVGQHGVGAILGLALSPDAKHLAFQDLDAGMLKVLSVAGGQPRELVKFEGKATITWTPDGSHLLYANWLSEPPAELWRIPVKGGEPRKVNLEMAYLDHVRFHPNGRQITFMGKAEGDKIEVWVMENFLPTEWASGQ
jgi:Tol biopolymer transport system component